MFPRLLNSAKLNKRLFKSLPLYKLFSTSVKMCVAVFSTSAHRSCDKSGKFNIILVLFLRIKENNLELISSIGLLYVF